MNSLLSSKVIEVFSYHLIDIEKLSKKSHVEELSKITRLLSSTEQNLDLAGTLLENIESRVKRIEEQLGLETAYIYLFQQIN